MKILFLSHTYKTAHDVLTRGIIEVLTRNNHCVDCEPQESVSYDCVFVFNRRALENYDVMLREKQLPVIYFFCLSDITREYIVTDIMSLTLMFKDKILNIGNFPYRILYQDMIFPSYISKSAPHNYNERPLIYIRIENDYLGELTFLKLLPLLNQMDNYLIHYQSEHSGLQHLITNPCVEIINSKQNIREEINKADIVIGSGMIAAFSVQQEKKIIVVGERGYGGLVTNENLKYHISNCFQGRNGGKLDEAIPIQLVLKAIEAENSDTKETAKQLSVMQAQNEDKFIQRIEKMASLASRNRRF